MPASLKLIKTQDGRDLFVDPDAVISIEHISDIMSLIRLADGSVCACKGSAQAVKTLLDGCTNAERT